MLQFVRAANVLAGFSDPQAVVDLGRTCAFIAGGLAIFATFLLACTTLELSGCVSKHGLKPDLRQGE